MIVGLILLAQLLLVLLLLIAVRQARLSGKKSHLGLFSFKIEAGDPAAKKPNKDKPRA